MVIKRATKEDHLLLTELTKASKAHWEYATNQLQAWEEDLTITEDHIQSHTTYKAEINGQLIAYYSYLQQEEKTIYLENMFIHPNYIGKGYGLLLMKDFLSRIAPNIERVTLHADPNAEKFYTKSGFIVIGKKESSIPGRFLPYMEKRVGASNR